MARKNPGPITERRLARLRGVLERRQVDLEVVLEDVWDGRNASAVMRSVDAFGAGALGLLYRQEEEPGINRRVSGYTRRWVTRRRYRSLDELVEATRERGARLVATGFGAGTVDYRELDWTGPTALVFGNEGRGCAADVLAAADVVTTIRMRGFAGSLNVSVAAAVILAEAARQRDAAGLFAPSWDDARERVLRTWVDREEQGRRRWPGREEGLTWREYLARRGGPEGAAE